MEKQLSTRQANAILFVVMIASKLIMLPSVISYFSEQDTIFVFLFSFILDFAFSLGVICLIDRLDETILHFLERKIGKLLTIIIAVLFALLFTMKSVDIIIENYILFDEKIYVELNKSLFFLMMLVFSCYFASRQLRSFRRTVEILLFLICFSFVLTVIVSFAGMRFNNLLPMFTTGARNIFVQVFKKNFWFGDFIFMLPFVGNVQKIKFTKKRFIMTYVFSSIVILFFVAIFLGIFNQTASMHRICMLDICGIEPRLISEGRFNWLVDFSFPIASLFVLAYCGYCAVNCFQYFVKQKFLSDKTISVMLYIGLGVGALIYFDFNWTNFFNFIDFIGPYYCFAIQYVLVFIFFIIFFTDKGKILSRQKYRGGMR